MPSIAKGANIFHAGDLLEGDVPMSLDDFEGESGFESSAGSGPRHSATSFVGHKRKYSSNYSGVSTPTTSLGPGSASAPPSKKRQLSNGANALAALGEQLSNFTDTVRKGTSQSPLEPSPTRKRIAIQRAEELETELDDKHLVQLINLFEADINAADAYMVIKREGLRKAWVEGKLNL